MTRKLPWCSSLSTADLEPRHDVKQNTGVHEQLQPEKQDVTATINNKTKRVTANLRPGKNKQTVRTNF